jgi:hypothetical protein
MNVAESNGTQTAYALSNIQKMSFSSGNLTVTKKDNNSGVYALSDLRYLNFSDHTTSLDMPVSVKSHVLFAFPNPAGNTLNIDLSGTAQGKGTLCLLNLEGKIVLKKHLNNAGVLTLDIRHLPKGIYICHYSNTTEVKTVKIIKH